MNVPVLLPGDFGLTQISGNVGRMIRVGQWLNGDGFANFEHAFLYIGNGQIVEAEPGGARLGNVNEYSDIFWSSGKIPLTDAQRTLIVHAACHQLGVPYSFADYFALAAHRLHIPAPNLRHFIADSGHQICSQQVDYCYQVAGVQLFKDGRWCGDVVPLDLYNLVR